ncbi:MAG: hypothetical protein IKF36_02935 [Bacilli bacterium]|nr:hypothetical protein [Bacilli bacterium]
MNIDLIKIYINNLTKEQALNFLNNKSIYLSDSEFEYLFKLIKTEYKKIIDEESSIMNDIKNNISLNNYLKLYNLLKKYKKYLK